MTNDGDRFKLRFGPRKTPRFRYAATVVCEVRGECIIHGIADGKIPWRVGRTGPRYNSARRCRWAKPQTLPVIAVGDWNFDYDIDDGEGNQAFKNLQVGNVWKWARPPRLHKTQLSRRFFSCLDFVLTANLPATWKVDSWIRTDAIPAKDDNKNGHCWPLVGRLLFAN